MGYNFYHGVWYREPPAVYQGYAYRPLIAMRRGGRFRGRIFRGERALVLAVLRGNASNAGIGLVGIPVTRRISCRQKFLELRRQFFD